MFRFALIISLLFGFCSCRQHIFLKRKYAKGRFFEKIAGSGQPDNHSINVASFENTSETIAFAVAENRFSEKLNSSPAHKSIKAQAHIRTSAHFIWKSKKFLHSDSTESQKASASMALGTVGILGCAISIPLSSLLLTATCALMGFGAITFGILHMVYDDPSFKSFFTAVGGILFGILTVALAAFLFTL